FANLDQIRDTVVTMRDGAPITIGQIAHVVETHEKLNSYDRVNGELGLRFGIRKEASANTVDVAKGILEEVVRINQNYPQINIVPILNQGNFIELSIANVARSVLYGGGLAILVLLFFLRNLRSTVIISLAIPISIIATFALMYGVGLTLNLMTLGGLALGVGMMVDSSIVVLENIFRRRDELDEHPKVAAAEGAREVSGAILASTLTTLVIFLPLVFTRGVTGMLFRDLAYVIVFSLICSLLVSLSLVPMLSSKLLKRKGEARKQLPTFLGRWFTQASESFTKLESFYQRCLRSALKHRGITVTATVVALAASFLVLPFIGTELLPASDESEVHVDGEMETGTRMDIVNEIALDIEAMVAEAVPETRATYAEAQNGDMEIRLSLVPVKQRTRSSEEIADDLRELLENKAPGMELRVRAPRGQFILNRLLGGGTGVDVEIRGYDLDVLDALAKEVADTIRSIDGVADVRTDRREGIPQEEIRVDRAKVADLGLSVRDVTSVIRTAIAGSDAGDYYEGGYASRILVQLRDAEHLPISEVLNLNLSTPSGDLVALRNLVTTESGRSPLVISRKEQQRISVVDVNISGRAPGTVAAEIQERLNTIPRPKGYSISVAGTYQEQEESFHELVMALVLALLLVYMVLACQYESLRDPMIVMTSAPMAAIGVLITLFVTGTTFNLQSGIGCIMLGGIVVNNAILLVDQAGQLTRQGLEVHEAVMVAGKRRLRPILMTTLTTMLGL
ncbi:MAG: efflux RND transporter permease subunit, partial [Verrucomicrobiae bacterium]|nr:efflux RND transporter permease subunit [Verrucomicrobiae bacterium]